MGFNFLFRTKIEKKLIYGYLAVYIFFHCWNFAHVKRKRRVPNKKFRKALGKRIRELRLLEKMSQSQFGFEVGIHRDQVGRIERGIQSPSADSLEAMACVFNLKIKEFLDFNY